MIDITTESTEISNGTNKLVNKMSLFDSRDQASPEKNIVVIIKEDELRTPEDMKKKTNFEFFRQRFLMFPSDFVRHSNLATWMKDNQFLVKHHRPHLNSVWLCIISMFYLHTETINIWTHFLGCIMYFIITICYLFDTTDSLTAIDKVMFTIYFVGAFIALLCSWSFHTFACHSQIASESFSKMDYCGIVTLIVGSFIPWIYYVFYCRNIEKYFYIGFIAVLSIPVFVVSLFNKFATPDYRTLRAVIFLGLGLSTLVPILHAIIVYGFMEAIERAGLNWLVVSGGFYIFGAVIYACRVPERLFPGRCDIFVQSHQIFHVFVVIGTFVHHYGLKELFYLTVTKYDCPTTPSCIEF